MAVSSIDHDKSKDGDTTGRGIVKNKKPKANLQPY